MSFADLFVSERVTSVDEAHKLAASHSRGVLNFLRETKAVKWYWKDFFSSVLVSVHAALKIG